MRILVYGAGNMGSLYAALLKQSGQEVSILARGQRLADIREHGIQLEDFVTGKPETVRVQAVERLEAEDAYDLVLVILPKDCLSEVLPILAANRRTPNVLFFGNNAAGPRQMVEALGRKRVLLGFPGSAALACGHRIRYLILSEREQPTTIGELEEGRSPRLQAIAEALKGAGFPVSICPDMDAWLKTHAAEISSTACALYMTGGNPRRLARTRDALLLMLRAIREGYKALSAQGIPITPKNHRVFQWLPEPLLLAVMRRMIESDSTSIKVGHALHARREMKVIAEELRDLVQAANVRTPSIDILNRYLDERTEPIPEGSAEIPVSWMAVWVVLAVFALSAALLSLGM